MDDAISPAILVDSFKFPEDYEAFRDWILDVLTGYEEKIAEQDEAIQLLKDLVNGEG